MVRRHHHHRTALTPVTPDANAVRLEDDINFDLDQDTPHSPENAEKILDKVATYFLAAVTKAKASGLSAPTLEIGGHTDTTGRHTHNVALAERRANWVVDGLTKRGVDAANIKTKIYAEQDLKDGKTGNDLQNRRDTFDIIPSADAPAPTPDPEPTASAPPAEKPPLGERLEADGKAEVHEGVQEIKRGGTNIRHGVVGFGFKLVGLPFHLVAEVGRTVAGSGHGADKKPGMIDDVGTAIKGTGQVIDGSGKVIVGSGKVIAGKAIEFGEDTNSTPPTPAALKSQQAATVAAASADTPPASPAANAATANNGDVTCDANGCRASTKAESDAARRALKERPCF